MYNPVEIFISWKPIVEILLLWFILYQMMLFFEGTRAFQVLRGILVILLAFLLFHKLGLQVIDWLFIKLFGISVIAALIIFQPEIRHGLARLGQRHMFTQSLKEEELDYILRELMDAAESLSRIKLGALIAIEKHDPLTSYADSGVTIDGRVSSDIIQAIFTPNNPLHDGGVIIQRGRITAAGCLFPLSENLDLSRFFGTRHRAALGLSEDTDAVIIIVSEERQDISVVYKGKIHRDMSKEDMITKMKEIMKARKDHGKK